MKPMKIATMLLALVVGLLSQQTSDAQDVIRSSAHGNGGGIIWDGDQCVSITIGQPLIGVSGNLSDVASFGFWYTAGPAYPIIIIATAGMGGSILPSGEVIVNYGSDQMLTIVADKCYHVEDVLVDGESVGAVTKYTFENIISDRTISATFAIDTHTITATAGENGSILPSGEVIVNCGSDQIFSLKPDEYYQVAGVMVDGEYVNAVNEYTFEDVASDHTIAASFEPVPLSMVEIRDDTDGMPQKAGDVLTITVIQNSDALLADRGEFDIGEKIRNQTLYNDGTHGDMLSGDSIWTGRYEVKHGDDVNNALIKARLYAFGKVIEKSFADRIIIDTVPPRVLNVKCIPDPVQEPGPITITITFYEEGSGVDTDTPVSVSFTPRGDDEKPVKGSYVSGTEWRGTGSILVDDNDGSSSLTIRGGQDRAGNALLPPDESVSFQIDMVEEISWVRHDAVGLLKAGDVLSISMKGEAGKNASFDIEGLISGSRMNETDFGIYAGTYVVKAGNNVVDAAVVCHLGDVTEVVGVTVTIDTINPVVESVLVEPETAKAGDIIVSVVFTERMDVSVEPSVAFVPGSGKSSKLDGKYGDDQTWRGIGIITAELGNGWAKVVVSGAQDMAGNVIVLYEAASAFIIDTIPPNNSHASVIIEDGAEYTSKHSLNFTFDGFTEESAIEGYYYSLTDGSGKPDGTYTQELSGNVIAEDGEAIVHVWARDKAGNIGAAAHDSIIIDTDPPTVTEATLPELVKAGAITVSICFHDDRSGMSDDPSSIKAEIQMEDGTRKIYLKNVSYSADDIWKGAGEVTHGMNDDDAVMMIGGAKDKAGNEMLPNRSYHLAIDTDAPDPPGNLNATPGIDGTITLNWEGTRATDVSSYRVYSDSKVLKDGISASSRSWTGTLPDGQYGFGVSAVDKAGNEGLKAVSGYVEIDGTPPAPITNLTSESLPGAIVKLSWEASPSSDVTKYRIVYDGSKEEETDDIAWESKELVDGTLYTFTVTAMDEMENESTGKSVVVKAVENEPPTVALEDIRSTQHSDVSVRYHLDDREKDNLSIICEYRKNVDSRWNPASTTGRTTNITSYDGEIAWRSRMDIPSTSGMDVQFRIIAEDNRQKGTPDDIELELVNLLADYNDDERIDRADMEIFQVVWEQKDISMELGSKYTDGKPPDLTFAPDGVVDFEDLAIFSLMWVWTEESIAAAPRRWLVYDRNNLKPVLNITENSILNISLPTRGLMGYVSIEYDTNIVRISLLGVSGRNNAIFLPDMEHPGRIILAFADLKHTPDNTGVTTAAFGLHWKANAKKASIVFHYDIRDLRNRTVASSSEARKIYQLPEAFALHQNYPNPFNPETWIPYQLDEDANVVISIYAVTGQLIRELNLGHKQAGFYTDRENAAYWDGRDDNEEPVASGMYFYSITAGDYTATRKMTVTR